MRLLLALAIFFCCTTAWGFESYQEVVGRLHDLEQRYPDKVSVGVIGRTSQSTPIYGIRITDESVPDEDKIEVLLTGCIHGNEPISTTTLVAFVETLLRSDEDHVKQLLARRKVFLIPVVSPDTYARARHVEGVDPNRDFDRTYSCSPIQVLKDFVLQRKFRAAGSGHSYGRMFLYPYGNSTKNCPDDLTYRRILSIMGMSSQYKVLRGCQVYGRPIYGTEMDWYYKNGIAGIVIEFGTHQRVPSQNETKYELERTYYSLIYFIKYGPFVLERR